MGYRYKLTPAQHTEIRAKYRSTQHLNTRDPERYSYASLCKEYNVCRDTIYKILNYQYRHGAYRVADNWNA